MRTISLTRRRMKNRCDIPRESSLCLSMACLSSKMGNWLGVCFWAVGLELGFRTKTGRRCDRFITLAMPGRRSGVSSGIHKTGAKAGAHHAVLAGFLGWTLDAFDFFVVVF